MTPTLADAEFSADRRYRYCLTREWDDGKKPLGFVMLNPSTANEKRDDPTLARCVERARRLGFGAVEVYNLYAWCATDPAELRRVVEPVGRDNDLYLRNAAETLTDVVLAWGAHGHPSRAGAVVRLFQNASLPARLWHLGLLKGGQPRHPLHTAYAAPLQPWSGEAA